MNTELIKLREKLRAMQDELDRVLCEEEAVQINSKCGQLRREIRRHHNRAANAKAALRPRFTEHGGA